MNKLISLISAVALLLTGCMMGPNYKRPLVSVPSVYRSAAAPSPAEAAQPEISFGAVKWWTVFH
ncbi:MAG: transporter, partial [Acidobacteriota bacterium]|nr:transporter [Acidobacteriota bacterium]